MSRHSKLSRASRGRRRNHAIRALILALLVAVSQASVAAAAADFRNASSNTAAVQEPVLLLMLTVLLTVAKTKAADSPGNVPDSAIAPQGPALLLADAERGKEWVRGAD